MIKYVTGNILHEQSDAIVNTVNTVGVMGKGLALQFKKAFPLNFEAYKSACDSQSFSVGDVLSVSLQSLNPPYYIINFPTKAHWKGKSKLEFIDTGLDALVSEVQKLDLKSVSLPALGSGLGGLDWEQVKSLIENKLSEVKGVEWRIFPPQSAPAAKAMVNKTARPNMTAGRAAVLGLIDRYINKGLEYELSLLEVQKLVYFLTASGFALNQVKFAKHHYGPYADVLRHVLNRMEGHFISGYADGINKPDTSIEIFTEAAQQAKQYLSINEGPLDNFEQVSDLVEGYESPYGMELLSTVHWVATQEVSESKEDLETIINRVHSWSKRKSQMKPLHIQAAWQTLKSKGWLDKSAQV